MKMKRFYILEATAYEPRTGQVSILTKQQTRHETKAEAIRHGERLRARHEWAGFIITRYNQDENGKQFASKRRPYQKPSVLEEQEAAAIVSKPTAGGNKPMSADELADLWEALDDMGAGIDEEAELMAAIEEHYKAEAD